MDEQFEKQLNDKVQNSYEIKTSAEDILSAYHAKQNAKKPFNYKVPFFASLGTLACAAVALAIVLPLNLSKTTSTPSVSSLGSLADINVSPLKSKEGTLAYEVSSVYPLLKRLGLQKAPAKVPSFGMKEEKEDVEDRFESFVEGYEKVQAPVRDSFLGTSADLTAKQGSFVGKNGTYDYQVVIPEVGTLLYSLDKSLGNWSKFSGEVSDSEKTYSVEGRTITTNGVENLTLKLFDNEDNDFVSVEQNKNKSTFFFSYSIFEDGLLSYTFSLSLLQLNSTTPMIALTYYLADDAKGGSLQIVWESKDIYQIYGEGFSKILLNYKNGQRIYTYLSYVITEN